MPPVRLSKSAERWFLNRISELAEINPVAAGNLIERLERQKRLLLSFPEMSERGLIEGTRKVSMPPLVLTVRLKNGVLEIAAIRDARQRDAYAPDELAGDKEA
jgi:plasmid stabilization system protein ParE